MNEMICICIFALSLIGCATFSFVMAAYLSTKCHQQFNGEEDEELNDFEETHCEKYVDPLELEREKMKNTYFYRMNVDTAKVQKVKIIDVCSTNTYVIVDQYGVTHSATRENLFKNREKCLEQLKSVLNHKLIYLQNMVENVFYNNNENIRKEIVKIKKQLREWDSRRIDEVCDF